jgi:hypothetical protein
VWVTAVTKADVKREVIFKGPCRVEKPILLTRWSTTTPERQPDSAPLSQSDDTPKTMGPTTYVFSRMGDLREKSSRVGGGPEGGRSRGEGGI